MKWSDFQDTGFIGDDGTRSDRCWRSPVPANHRSSAPNAVIYPNATRTPHNSSSSGQWHTGPKRERGMVNFIRRSPYHSHRGGHSLCVLRGDNPD